MRKRGIYLESQNFCVQMAKEKIFKEIFWKTFIKIWDNFILKNLQRLTNFVAEPTGGTQTDNEYHSAPETMSDDEV